MKEKLSTKQFLILSLLLFGMFFGSGNLIFPPLLGYQAGPASLKALLGFSVTAIIFPVLGILAISKTKGVENLGKRVGTVFSKLYPAVVFLAIGPGIALPRNGVLPFDMAIAPYLVQNDQIVWFRLFYTFIFFSISCYLSLSPKKLIDRLGKILSPILIFLIVLLFVNVLFRITSSSTQVMENYAQPIYKGFIEGYNTMDTLASLNFGFVITLTIQSFHIQSENKIIKYASKAGLVAGSLLFAIYGMLIYVGTVAITKFLNLSNGGEILFYTTNYIFGNLGSIVLITIFTLACMTTAVGLITSVSQYFTQLFNEKITYKSWVVIFTLISFGLSNFGLNTILKFSVPILITIYPVAIVLIVLALTQSIFNYQSMTYQVTIYSTLIISFLAGLNEFGITFPTLQKVRSHLPLVDVGLEWLIPILIVLIIMIVFEKLTKDREV